MSFTGLLDRTIIIERAKVTQDTQKAKVNTWAPVETNVKARIEQMTSREREIAGRAGAEATHWVYIGPQYTTVTVADRIKEGTVIYKIIGVEECRGGKKIHHFEIMTQRLT